MPQNKLTISIVSYDSQELLDCISAIKKTVKTPHQIFVVENNPKSRMPEKIKEKFPEVSVTRNTKNLGYGAGNNLVLKQANGPVLVLNPDVVVGEGTVDLLLVRLKENKKINIIGCKLLNEDRTLQYSCRRFPTVLSPFARILGFVPFAKKEMIWYEMQDEPHSDLKKVDWISGSFMLMKKPFLFDESIFLYAEDLDLCRQVGRVYYDGSVAATHKGKWESRKSLQKTFWHARSYLQYFIKWGLK